MNTLSGIFLTSFLIGFSGAITPGPILTITISKVTQRGFWAGPLIVLGHGILELFLFIAVILGIGQWLSRPVVKGLVAILGGIALLWLGGGMSWKSCQSNLNLVETSTDRSIHPVAAGFLISISNPYWTIWWATIGLSYIALSLSLGWQGLSAFYFGHILADLIWYSLIAGVFSIGKKSISPKLYHSIIFVCGLLLFLFGLYFLYSGYQFLIIIQKNPG